MQSSTVFKHETVQSAVPRQEVRRALKTKAESKNVRIKRLREEKKKKKVKLIVNKTPGRRQNGHWGQCSKIRDLRATYSY